MGDQAKPVDDDVERALASMRAGFLSGAEQVAAHIAAFDDHLFDVRGEEREAVRAQFVRLVAAHDRITAKVTAAPATAWDSFKVMVSAVKQQQDVLDQIIRLMQQHVVPRQIAAAQAAAAAEAAALAAEQAQRETPLPRDDLFPPHPLFPADDVLRADDAVHAGGSLRAGDVFRPDDSLHAGAPARGDIGFPPIGGDFSPQLLSAPQQRPVQGRQQRSQPARQSRLEVDHRRRAAARAREEDDEGFERLSLLATLRERTAGFRGLAAMLVVGVIISMLPRDRLQEMGTKLFALIGPAGTEIAADDPPGKPAQRWARSVDRVPSAAVAEATESRPEPMPEPRPEVRPSAQLPRKRIAALPAEEPPAPLPAPKRVEPPAPAEEPAAPPQQAAAVERFVPVVFTHKDHATVMRALADLKQQYPNALIGLEGEVQPVDMGKKGIWHRLVFLPAGPRPQASRVCDQLAAQGYDRCYVRTY